MGDVVNSQELANNIFKVSVEVVDKPVHRHRLSCGFKAGGFDELGIVVDTDAGCQWTWQPACDRSIRIWGIDVSKKTKN